jgi:hypothetical protein
MELGQVFNGTLQLHIKQHEVKQKYIIATYLEPLQKRTGSLCSPHYIQAQRVSRYSRAAIPAD